MTKKELEKKYVKLTGDYWNVDKVLDLVEQYVINIIGKDENVVPTEHYIKHGPFGIESRNELRAVQRKRARLGL